MDEEANTPLPPPPRFPTLRVGLASAVALWLAQPPVGWWPLAWVAPMGWLWIARRAEPLDRGDWLRVYLSGVVYWLLAVHWIRLPHPLTILGWPILCAYLGLYPLAFVWLTRVGLRRARVPLWLVAPVVWTGLEFLQANLFTGFLMGAVSHSQVDRPSIAWISGYIGAYGVSFVVLLWVSLMTHAISSREAYYIAPKFSVGVLLAVSLLCPWIFFSVATDRNAELQNSIERLKEDMLAADQGSISARFIVALIQGNTLATWDPDPERSQKIMDAQVRLSIEAVERAEAEGKQLDLIVWPESMFRVALDTFDGQFAPPPGTHEGLVDSSEHCKAWFRSLAAKLETPVLVGIDHYDWKPDPVDPDGLPQADSYNSAVLADAEGKLLSVYNKTHRVPFGEYIPLAGGMPALYFLTPMSGGLKPGEGPVAMELLTKSGDTVRLAPSICFETAVPQVIRSHVAELTDQGGAPNLLVNVTNDAWFWGSSELDTHLACAQFRAIETGTPMIVAANGGLSAVISATGEVLAVSGRMQEEVVLADVPLRISQEPTPYVRYGDWFAIGCLLACGLLAIMALLQKRREPQINTDEHGSEDESS